MKCSSRRNCDVTPDAPVPGSLHVASMKCSSRRNCDVAPTATRARAYSSLNEVQFPKELRP